MYNISIYNDFACNQKMTKVKKTGSFGRAEKKIDKKKRGPHVFILLKNAKKRE